MPDTVRTDEENLANLADNAVGNISAQDMRDVYVSLLDRIASGGGDSTPDQFTFTDVTDANVSTEYESSPVTLSGMTLIGLARVSGAAEMTVNGGSRVSEAVVQNGDVIRLYLSSSANNSTTVQTQLTVGGTSDTWSITTGNFWTPEVDPELIAFGFFQEDVAEGALTNWTSRGRKPKTGTGTATKLANNGGVLFTGAQQLQWGTDTDAPYLNRWWVVIARADLNAVASNNAVPILTVHSASTSIGARQPLVSFVSPNAQTMTSSIYDAVGNRSLLGAADPVFANWNVLVGYRRGGFHYASINGEELGPIEHLGWLPQNTNQLSWLGAGTSAPGSIASPVDMAIDCVIVGQGELSDALIDKIIGWAHWRAGREDLLPVGHPYKNAAPALDGSEGTISRFVFNQADWDAWAGLSTAEKTPNIGGTPEPLDDGSGDDYAVVFKDDFITRTVKDDLSGAASEIWYAPTHVIGINVNAGASTVDATPDCYVHDAGNHTLALRLQETASGNGNWVSGAFSSINRHGQGRTWTKGRFRVRCKFPLLAAPRPGFFPAFWGYSKEHLFWRTRNRLEHDYFEYDGLDGTFINTTQHIHAASLSYNHDDIAQASLEDKIIGLQLDSDNNFSPTIDIYDGAYHVWEFRIEDDFSYIIVDDKEVARVPTEAWLLLPKYIIVDWAYRSAQGLATAGQTYDMTIDWIEVQVRERDLDNVPTGFSARPTLSGTRGIGNTITCTPNTTASQIQFRWYKNGEPIVGATGATFVEDADSVTKDLRVHVVAKSLLNQPEAWTAVLAAPADTEDPSVPTNLVATAISDTRIDLTWTASTDNIGVAGYKVRRDGGAAVDVGNVTSYSDTGLTAATLYSYTVSAYDAAANESAESTADTETTLAASYTANPVAFDGNTNLLRGANLTGVPADGPEWAVAFAFRRGASGSERFIITNSNQRFRVSFTGGATPNRLRILGMNGAGTTILHIQTVTEFTDNLWHHFVASGNGTTNHLYIDGVSDIETVIAAGGNIDFDGGSDWGIGSRTDGNNDYVGEMADVQLWLGTGAYIDLSVQASREEFYNPSTRKPKDPADIEAAFGEPIVQQTGATGSWHTNTGSGGGFTVSTGTLTTGETPVQWPVPVTQTSIDTGLNDGDPIDTADITGNGLFDILFVEERGIWYWYEQTSAGNFTRHTIDGVQDGVNTAFEACAWADMDGDGAYEAYGADQNSGNIWCYVQDSPGTPEGTWTGAVIRAARNNLQAMHHFTIDGTKCLIYTWEGNGAGAGGVNCLTYNGSGALTDPANWTDTQLVQHNGAWALDPDGLATRGADTILYFGARNRLNASATPGVFYITKPTGSFLQTWAKTTIFQDANDWTRITRGDFFGDGSPDIAQHDSGNQGTTDVTIKLYRSTGDFVTSVTLTQDLKYGRYNLRNVVAAKGQVNGRDPIVGSGGFTKGIAGGTGLWTWTGTAWTFDKWAVETQKVDGTIKVVQVASSATPDLLMSDSFTNKIYWIDGATI